MYGNFTRVNRQGADKIRVEGWLVWETGDTKADLTISVSQGNSTVSGPKTVTPSQNPTNWEVVISDSGHPILPGIAAGEADAVVFNGSGTKDSNWVANPIPVN